MPLDEIIRKHAQMAIDQRKEAAAREGKTFDIMQVAQRMRPWLPGDKGKLPSAHVVQKRLRRLLGISNEERYKGVKIPWPADYIEAFSQGMDIRLTDLLSAELGELSNVDPLDWAVFLGKFLRRELTPYQVERLKEQLEESTDRPGGFDFISEIWEILLDASDPKDAAVLAGGVIQNPANEPFFAAKRGRVRKKRTAKN